MSCAPVDLDRPTGHDLARAPETFVNRTRSIVICTPVRLGRPFSHVRTNRPMLIVAATRIHEKRTVGYSAFFLQARYAD
jgi:hypothetical protein